MIQVFVLNGKSAVIYVYLIVLTEVGLVSVVVLIIQTLCIVYLVSSIHGRFAISRSDVTIEHAVHNYCTDVVLC